jgi:hypothetical protein
MARKRRLEGHKNASNNIYKILGRKYEGNMFRCV